MKKIFILLAATLAVCINANALIVSVQGYGEVPTEGMDIEITEGEEDELTGDYTMEVQGTLLTSAAQIKVLIVRSDNGLSDEFCCGSNCTAGDGTQNEEKTFNMNGPTNWYAHYTPQPNSYAVIRFAFDDGEEQREVRVVFNNLAEGIEPVQSEKEQNTKVLCDGQLVIRCNNSEYSIDGKQL